MSIDIQELKRLNPIADVVEEFEEFKLDRRARGKYLTGEIHDSFVVNVEAGLYNWNSKGRAGDVISFLQNEVRLDFRGALEYLARRAGVALHLDEKTSQRLALRRQRADVLTTCMGFLQGKLLASSAAMDYLRGRGWTAETAAAARLGFWDGDRAGLLGHLKEAGVDVAGDVAKAVLGIKPGMLVYGHWQGAHCEYFSCRSIEGKSHYNPPAELMGERLPYWNHALSHATSHIVVVEGQADAVTLAQWRIPAVALAGTAASPALARQLDAFDRVYVALDADEAGQGNVGVLAAQLGPMTRVVTWPAQEDEDEPPIKDANDWLQAGGTEEVCRELLGGAPHFALWLCERAATAAPLQREAAEEAAVAAVAKLPDYAYEKSKAACARALGVDLRTLNGMVRALKKDTSAAYKIEVEQPNGYLDGHLFELLYEPDHKDGPRTSFAVRYPDGRISVARIIETENYRILPLPPWDTILQRGFIKCPTQLGQYGSEVELQQEIQAFIHKYVDVPEHIEVMASYYVMMTWLFDVFYVLPYLRARGDSDSGKSRFTETVGYLCFRPMMITGATTPSPVFRLMEKWNGLTVVMDEADLPHTETSADWTMMLNTGYKKESGILRTAINNGEARVEGFSAFGPKVLNMRKKFIDDATESRCLTWETSSGRNIRPDIPRYMDREQFQAEALAIRNKLLRWRLNKFSQVEIDYNEEGTEHMPGRLVEITVSLMSISDSEEFKESVMDFIRKMNRKAVIERQMGLPAKVLEGLLRAKFLPDGQALAGEDKDLLQVAHVTRQTNRVLNRENEEATLQDSSDDSEGYKPRGELSWQKVGHILRTDLNLDTEKSHSKKNPYIVVWDEGRIDALVRRYGYEELFVELVEKGYEAEKKREKGEADEPEQAELKL